MEQSESISNLGEQTTGVPKNLKTLCILSLVMGGLMVLVSLWNLQKIYMPSEQDTINMQQQLDMAQQANPEAYGAFTDALGTQGTQLIIGLVLEILSIISVIMMLKLKKTGFHLYLVAELLPYVFTIALAGFTALMGPWATLGGIYRTMGLIVAILMVVCDGVFIFLYSKQVKHLK